jgi:hypothetical protein
MLQVLLMNTMLTKNSSIAFIILGIALPVVALSLFYGTYNWNESIVLSCLFIGVCLWLALFGWSIWSIRRHRIRAIVGLLDCAYCFWQLLYVISKW